jgi:hypothetical protein
MTDADTITELVALGLMFASMYGTPQAQRRMAKLNSRRGTSAGKAKRFHVSTQQTFTGDGCNMATSGKSGRAGFVWLAWVGIADPLTKAGNRRRIDGHMEAVIGGLDMQPGRYGTNTPKRGSFWLETASR